MTALEVTVATNPNGGGLVVTRTLDDGTVYWKGPSEDASRAAVWSPGAESAATFESVAEVEAALAGLTPPHQVAAFQPCLW